MRIIYSFDGRVFLDHRNRSWQARRVAGALSLCREGLFLSDHPVWQVVRSTLQLAKLPYFVGDLAPLSGCMWCWITGHEQPVSPELMKFHRSEEMERPEGLLRRRVQVGR